ncbi:hypothetical protein [Fluviicola chungangensis]|uniref:Uncharacterized protein n=1 Tax=Fluviicola chungangensis TaxID=2597671 RepID=A0A556MMX8_9FLAO|nr:hypothetical protein [Fluviicola chungangensis]TSJ41294.1 hypothetical protein FO442_15395 [Fluviicola chungangensis]
MKKKIEAQKIEFAKNLIDSDYRLVCDYEKIDTCIEIICIRDLMSTKTKFKFFNIIGTDRILIKANNSFLIEYCIKQTGSKFELYELVLSKFNEFERELDNLSL